MSRLHGKNAQLWFNGTQVTVKTAYNLTQERDYADISVYGDQGKTFAAGIPAFSGSFEGLLDVGTSDQALVAAALGKVPIVLKADASTTIAAGDGFVDVTLGASVSGAVMCSGTIRGQGLWVLG